jgi:hypothetical protein
MALLGTDWLAIGNRIDPSPGFPQTISEDLLGTAIFGGGGLLGVAFNPDNTKGFGLFYNGAPWQNSEFPQDAIQQVNAFAQAGETVLNVVFNPGDGSGWVVICRSGAYAANGAFAEDVFAKMGELSTAGLVIQNVVFKPNDISGWLIICEGNGYYASATFPADAFKAIGDLIDAGNTLQNLLFTADDGSGWVIICQNNVWLANNPPDDLFQNLKHQTSSGMLLDNLVLTLSPYIRQTTIIREDSRLQDGDILLFAATDLVGETIDSLSGSNGYSHAGLVSGSTMIDVDNTDDPTDPQVELVPLPLALMRKHVGVRIGMRAIEAHKLCAWCTGKLGTGMNYAGLATAGAVNLPNTYICTMLIMNGLDAIGFDRSAIGLGGFISPNHIARTFHAPQGKSL